MESRDFPRGAIGAVTWWGGVSFFLFGLILLNNDLGPLTRQTSMAAAVLLFILAALIMPPRVFVPRQLLYYTVAIATTILTWFLTITENISASTQSYFLASTIIYAVGALWFDKNGLQSSLPAVLLLTGFLYSIFHLVYDASLSESIGALEGKAPVGKAAAMSTGRPGCEQPDLLETQMSTYEPSVCGGITCGGPNSNGE